VNHDVVKSIFRPFRRETAELARLSPSDCRAIPSAGVHVDFHGSSKIRQEHHKRGNWRQAAKLKVWAPSCDATLINAQAHGRAGSAGA
jgi:hypothetical protein